MAWNATGQPTLRKLRDKWVVRVDGIDTTNSKHRPRQLGHVRLTAIGAGGGAIGTSRGSFDPTRDSV